MFNFFSKSLLIQLVVIGVSATLITTLIIAGYAYNHVKNDRINGKKQELSIIGNFLQAEINHLLESSYKDLIHLAGMERVQNYTDSIGNGDKDKKIDIESYLTHWMNSNSKPYYRSIFLYNRSGNIIKAQRESDYKAGPGGIVVNTKEDKEGYAKQAELKQIADLFKMVSTGKKAVVTDFKLMGSASFLYMAKGIKAPNSAEIIGMVGLKIEDEIIKTAMEKVAYNSFIDGLHLVSHDDSVTLSYFPMKETSIGKGSFERSHHTAQPDNGAYYLADSNSANYLQNRFEFDFDNLFNRADGFKWKILVQSEKNNILANTISLGAKLILLSFGLSFIVGLIIRYAGRTITRPLTELNSSLQSVTAGDISDKPPYTSRKDELGELIKSYSKLMKALKRLTPQLRDFSEGLAGSATELAQTTSEMGSTYSSISATVTEISAAMEQVREAAKSSIEQAQEVSQRSRKAADVTEEGRATTEAVIEKMMDFKTRITLIADKVEDLRSRSGEIQAILSTVHELADQSNLLSINAAIEAMRAGEHGKGFAVVAQEIKNMADQSKDSADHIKQILADTARSVDEVIQTTKEGDTVIDEGILESAQAGHVIETLISSVENSLESAQMIEESTNFQFAGVDQVTEAINRVTEAMNQGLETNQHLENEAQKLKEMGLSLKILLEGYKV